MPLARPLCDALGGLASFHLAARPLHVSLVTYHITQTFHGRYCAEGQPLLAGGTCDFFLNWMIFRRIRILYCPR